MKVISIEISKLKFFLEMLVIERPDRVSLGDITVERVSYFPFSEKSKAF